MTTTPMGERAWLVFKNAYDVEFKRYRGPETTKAMRVGVTAIVAALTPPPDQSLHDSSTGENFTRTATGECYETPADQACNKRDPPDQNRDGTAELISRLSRHQTAFNSRSDLKIGHATINSDYSESIEMLRKLHDSRTPALRSLPDARRAIVDALLLAAGIIDGMASASDRANVFGRHFEAYMAAETAVKVIAEKIRVGDVVHDRNGLVWTAPPPSPQAGESKLRALVDWAYLHATEGDVWPGQNTIEQLIAKAKIGPPTQNDADAYRRAQPAKAGESREAIIEALVAIIRMDDDAKKAHGNPRSNLNGYGLVDLFDCVNHPFGSGEHKQKPYRSVQLETALSDARAAIAAAQSADPCPYCYAEMSGAEDCPKCGCGSPGRPGRTPQPHRERG
jgi:hypothetical protein